MESSDVEEEIISDEITSNMTEDSYSDDCDTVCAICDNGGELTCCEGTCRRIFHATPYSVGADESNCESLCLNPKVMEDLPPFTCENCQYSLHQCFVCAELGYSGKSSVTKVFRCSSETCLHFYHPECVAKLLPQNDETDQQILKEKIAAGEPFICPAHKCAVCKETEYEEVEDLQFAICRRCPNSYHRKCLPREIVFEHETDDYDAEIRAWNRLMTKSRALIYCMEHEIDPLLATPARPVIARNVLNRMSEQIQRKSQTYDPSLALFSSSSDSTFLFFMNLAARVEDTAKSTRPYVKRDED